MAMNLRSSVSMKFFTPAVLCAFFLASCGSLPFGERDVILPGERTAVVLNSSDVDPGDGIVRTVTLPAATNNSNWAQPGGSATNSNGNLSFSGSGSRAWRAKIDGVGRKGRPPTAGPIVYQGRVYVLDAKARVTAVGASNGGRAWRTALKPEGEGRHGASGGGVAADNGVIYTATGFGTVAALNAASGNILWQKQIDAPARSAPTTANGNVYVVSTENVVYGIKGSDGTELWSYRGIPESAGYLTSAAPAVSGERVIVPFTSGEIMAYNTQSGEPIWVDALTRSARYTAVSSLNDVSGRPVVDRGIVFAVSVSGRMIAVSETNGERLWTRNVSSAYTPVVAGDAVFVVTLEGETVALDRETGSSLWATDLPTEKRERWAGPVLAGGKIWVGSSKGRLASVNPGDGTVSGITTIGGSIGQSPVIANGRMYILSSDGDLIAVN